mgnify:CR=1 FL=1
MPDEDDGAGRKFDRIEFLVELEELLLRYRPGITLGGHTIAYHVQGLEEALFGMRDAAPDMDERLGNVP